jgi:hypothetical protein
MWDKQETVSRQATVLPIPQEYMQLLTNLEQIQQDTGCEILVNEPQPPSTEWEVTLLGTAEARHNAHQAIEAALTAKVTQPDLAQDADSRNVARETAEAEPASQTCTVLPVPQEYMAMLANLDQIGQRTGCDIRAVPMAAPSTEWEISLLGSPEARSMAHQAIEDTLTSQLSGEQANENTPGMDAAIAHGNFDAESTTVLPITEEYMTLLTNLDEIQQVTGCEIRVSEPLPPSTEWEVTLVGPDAARQDAHRAIESTLVQQTGDSAQDGIERTTVLPISEEYLGMLTNLNEIQQSTGCEIRVGKADNEWELTLVGSEQVRQLAHHAIEDTLASRVNADQVEADPSSDVCTVLPIPQDYIEFLTNLDQIQEYAGCQIQVKQPDQESGEWEISLFGSEAERTKAHEAIEETLRASRCAKVELLSGSLDDLPADPFVGTGASRQGHPP